MERANVTNLLNYPALHKFTDKEQHGFLTRRSTTTNLLESLNDWSVWSLNIENSKYQKVAHIDFVKASETVCHSKLIAKLSMYGIGGPSDF